MFNKCCSRRKRRLKRLRSIRSLISRKRCENDKILKLKEEAVSLAASMK